MSRKPKAADNTERKQSGLVPYHAGQSGNPTGRPKGSRNKLGEAFVADILADWQVNGAGVIAAVREADPVAYLKVVASVIPKQVDVKAEHSMHALTDAELMAIIHDTAAAAGLAVSEMADEPEQEMRH
jgi:hypothetical protein